MDNQFEFLLFPIGILEILIISGVIFLIGYSLKNSGVKISFDLSLNGYFYFVRLISGGVFCLAGISRILQGIFAIQKRCIRLLFGSEYSTAILGTGATNPVTGNPDVGFSYLNNLNINNITNLLNGENAGDPTFRFYFQSIPEAGSSGTATINFLLANGRESIVAVSYTHLTQPTKRIV